MRILIFNWKDLAHPLAGGAEVFTEELARALVTRGHSVTLFAASVPGKRAHERVEGVEIVRAGGRVGVYREARRFWARQERIAAYDVVIDEINTRPFMTPRWVRGTPIVRSSTSSRARSGSTRRRFRSPSSVATSLEPWWLRPYRDVPALTVSASSAESLRRSPRLAQRRGRARRMDATRGARRRPRGGPTVVFLGANGRHEAACSRNRGLRVSRSAGPDRAALDDRRRPASRSSPRRVSTRRPVPGQDQPRGGARSTGRSARPRRDFRTRGLGTECERGRGVRHSEHRLCSPGPRGLDTGLGRIRRRAACGCTR